MPLTQLGTGPEAPAVGAVAGPTRLAGAGRDALYAACRPTAIPLRKMRIAVRPANVCESWLLQAFLFFLIGLALSALVHGFTLRFGFDYDDYHLLRPYTIGEVLGTFVGPWDPSGVEAAFYRPVTTAFCAARFWLLGVDAWKYHALSLLMFSGAAALFGLFVALVAESRWAGALAVATYVVHPAMPRSQVAWATNQMHLIASLLVGGALVWWAARGRSGRGWGWLVAAAVVAFLVKEDGIMLLPLLVCLQLLWRWLVERECAWPPLTWLVLGGLALAVLLGVRYVALGGLGAYSARPTLEHMWTNYQVGARIGFFAKRSDRWFLWPWAEAFTLAVLAGGALAGLLLRQQRLGLLLLAGALGAALFNLPFVFVTKAEQYHLIASFSVVSMTAALALIWCSVPRAWWRATIGAAGVAGLIVLAAAARHRGELFTPYTPWTLAHDGIVLEWASVPLEIRDWVREGLRERRQPAVGPLSNVPVIVFGAADFETAADGRRVRWIGERTTILPAPDVRELDLPLMALTPLSNARFHVAVEADYGQVAAFTLRDGESVTVRVPLRERRTLFPLSRRVTATVTPPWRLRDVVQGTTDTELRTIRLGEIRVLRRNR